MALTRGDFLSTTEFKPVGKQQIYAFLVDVDGNAVLDSNGNEQIVELTVVEGRLQTDVVNLPGVNLVSNELIASQVITDTDRHNLTFAIPADLQVTKGKRSLIIVSTLDQAITTCRIFYGFSGAGSTTYEYNPPLFSLGSNGASPSIGAASDLNTPQVYFIASDEMPAIDAPADEGLLQVQCTAAPSQGTVSLFMIGGQ